MQQIYACSFRYNKPTPAVYVQQIQSEFLKCLVVVYFLSYPQNGVMRKMSLVTWLTYRSMWSIFWCFCFFIFFIFPSDFVMETDMQMLDSSLSYISYSASLLLHLCQVLVQHTRNTRISAGVCLELRQVSFFYSIFHLIFQ